MRHARAVSLLWVCWLTMLGGCVTAPQSPRTPRSVTLDELATRYVVLELAMGEIDSAHVDAYSGPPELRKQAQRSNYSLTDIDKHASTLAQSLQQAVTTRGFASSEPDDPEQPLRALRIDALLERITALRTRIAINQSRFASFNEESLALFGAVAPEFDHSHFQAVLDEIDALLPGAEPLAERVDQFEQAFEVPADKVDAVFQAALAECRRRTLDKIALPPNETFRIEYVEGKPWSGYNWYQGDAASLIQVNTDFPLPIGGAVGLGCHEAYPGHHTHNALLERELKNNRGWIEFSVYPLFSPQSFIAEGAGNYGVELAFPGDERRAFERAVLFPLAGLATSQADSYYELNALKRKLAYVQNEAARDYLDGRISRAEAVDFLMHFGLSTPQRAEQRMAFIETYRSYVINYNLGLDLVRTHIERGEVTPAEHWRRFERLLSEPASARRLAQQ